MLIYKLRAVTIRSDNGSNMPTAVIIEAITLPNRVEAFCGNTKM
jgi:hypothetical protein